MSSPNPRLDADVAVDPIVADSVELVGVILKDTKLDFILSVGYNKDGRRVLYVGTRLSGADKYLPVIEQDIDMASYWSDIKTGFDNPVPPPKEPPTPG